MFIITRIGSACQEEILINFEFLLIDNSISNFINISCRQSDVNSFFDIFSKKLNSTIIFDLNNFNRYDYLFISY